VLAVDPGSKKCGIAVVKDDLEVLEKMIVSSEAVCDTVGALCEKYPVTVIVIGNRTKSGVVKNSLAGLGIPVALVDEDRSSIEGRYHYLRENTRGLAKLFPIGLRIPKKPFDDYVAVILAERYLKSRPPNQ
jgi:RNase H-fold protein (predicted Holliday junction resolvase)